MNKSLLVLCPLLMLMSCCQIYDEGDDLRTVPVTNNPHVVPNHGSNIPGIGSG